VSEGDAQHDTASHEALAALRDDVHALDVEDESAPPKPAWRARVLTGVRIVAALGILFYLINTAVNQWSEVSDVFHTLTWPDLILAFIAVLLAVGCNMMSWRAAAADVDHRLPVRTAAPIMLVGQLGKYLPGSVWAYVVQADLARRAGVPRARAFVASLVSTGIGITIGLLLGTIGLPTALQGAKDDAHGVVGRIAFIAALVALPFALACAHPKVLTRLMQFLLKILRRPPLDRPLSWRGVLGPAVWSVLAYGLVGTHLWFLAHGTAPGFGGWLRCIGVVSLAMSVSVFVVIAPSGIGVREFLITIALGGGVAALAIALASRVLFTIADVVAAGAAAAVGLHRLKLPPTADLPEDAATSGKS
jgi:glycosyltransferase 2 family protein